LKPYTPIDHDLASFRKKFPQCENRRRIAIEIRKRSRAWRKEIYERSNNRGEARYQRVQVLPEVPRPGSMCHVLWCHCWRSCSSYPRAQIVIGLPRVLVLTPILDGFTVNYAQRWNANKDGSSGLPKVFLGVSNPCSPLFLSFPFPTFSPFPCAPFCDEFNAFCLKTEAIFHWPSGGVSSEIASVSVMPAWTGKCVHPWRLGSKESKKYPARLGPGFLGHCRIKPNLWQSNANSHAD